MNNGIVNIHGRQYKTVALRVAEFREKYPIETGWAIITDIVRADDQACVVKAEILNEKGATVATGYAEENRSSKGINSTSALENAETSAIGRALAAAGFGGDEYASADEVANTIKQENGKPAQPAKPSKPVLAEGSDAFNKAVKAIQRDGYTVADVEKKYVLTPAVKAALDQAETDAWQAAEGIKK